VTAQPAARVAGDSRLRLRTAKGQARPLLEVRRRGCTLRARAFEAFKTKRARARGERTAGEPASTARPVRCAQLDSAR
jgi:hypothetical protein